MTRRQAERRQSKPAEEWLGTKKNSKLFDRLSQLMQAIVKPRDAYIFSLVARCPHQKIVRRQNRLH